MSCLANISITQRKNSRCSGVMVGFWICLSNAIASSPVRVKPRCGYGIVDQLLVSIDINVCCMSIG